MAKEKEKHNVLDARSKYRLVRELDVYVNSPRKLTLTTAEFLSEASRELGIKLTTSNIESAARSLDLALSDIFKVPPGGGRSVYADIYKLTQRVEALEKKLEGL